MLMVSSDDTLIEPRASLSEVLITITMDFFIQICHMQAGNMDKYMRKVHRSVALKGHQLQDVRRHFKPTDDSYDNVSKADHQHHTHRLLLKAEPQVGKTGMLAALAPFSLEATCQ